MISIWDAGSTYLLSFFPCQFLKWRPAKPRTGMSIWFTFLVKFCTVATIWKFLRSIEDDRAASERVDSSSKDVERFTSQCFSLLVIQPLLSGLLEVFLHVRCIPHQNSQRCFWASVNDTRASERTCERMYVRVSVRASESVSVRPCVCTVTRHARAYVRKEGRLESTLFLFSLRAYRNWNKVD